MATSLYFLFFVAQLFLVNGGGIDANTLANVFGYPGAASSVQAQAIKQVNGTLVDPDYWDSDDSFTPSNTDYDKFDWTLTKRVAASSEDNFLLSPLGLKLALAILTEAATGATQDELSSVLGFDLDRNIVRRKFANIIESLKKQSPEYILNLGSRIYVGNSAQPRQRFAAIAEEFYKTELKTVDFENSAAASKQINEWVSNITAGRIPNLVNEDDVVGMVVLILNTLYFKGSWRHQFAPNATKQGPFYVSPKKQTASTFMNVKDNFYYAESHKYDAKILRMPYRGDIVGLSERPKVPLRGLDKRTRDAGNGDPSHLKSLTGHHLVDGNKFAMYIIVPNSITGLPRVLNGLSDLRLELDNLSDRLVDVTLPKFKFDYTSQLDGVLRELGVRQAFEDTASFPGIARGQLLHQRLRVSKVLQRSGIEVNELGSIAYSATEIALENKFGIDTTSSYEVIADKPFLFFIQDEPTRQLLFTGRVSNPNSVDGAFKLA